MDRSTREQLIDATEAFHEEDNWPAVEALWRPHVERGDLEAQFRLACYYLFYSFDEEANTRAEMEDLLRKASNGGYADAVYWLGHPVGEERDSLLLKAGELGRAAERGHSDAQYNLGFVYVLGEGVQSDPEEGLRWVRLAAAQGEGSAMRLLADLYRNGFHGVPLDPLQAADWDRQYRADEERRVKRTEEAA